jgi:hypothetical protein
VLVDAGPIRVQLRVGLNLIDDLTGSFVTPSGYGGDGLVDDAIFRPSGLAGNSQRWNATLAIPQPSIANGALCFSWG